MNQLNSAIEEIRQSQTPVSTSWKLACQRIGIEKETAKLTEVILDHENLFRSNRAYHNEYHTAETVYVSAFLSEGEDFGERHNKDSRLALMLAASFHDTDLDSKCGKKPFDVENASAMFFKDWWKNNSLFVESLIRCTPTQMEQAVIETILFTDFTEGHKRVNSDYINKKENETYGLKMAKIKKIMNESDLLLSVLPQYSFDKMDKLLREFGKTCPDFQTRIYLLIEHINNLFKNNHFCSDGVRSKKIPETIKSFYAFLKENKSLSQDEMACQIILKFG